MAEPPKDDSYFYPQGTLKKAFGISSAVMLLFTLWMVLDDFARPWKEYQREFMVMKRQKAEKQVEEATGQIDATKLKEAQDKVTAAEKDLAAKSKDEARIQGELVKATTVQKLAMGKYQDEKAIWDVEKYHYEAEFGHEIAFGKLEAGEPHEKAAHEKLMKHWDKVLELRNKANLLAQQQDAKKKELDDFLAGKTAAEKEVKTLRAEVDKFEMARKNSELTLTKLMRNAPILDMANPVFRIQQIVLPTIRDDIFFSQVQKVDRCTTCHLAIDLPGWENEKQPFKTHPKLDLMLGSRSPHPIDKVGCTTCHDGRGQSVDFVRTAHTPHSEEQKKEWEKNYHWHEMHHVIEKMVPLQYTEGKCRVCHRQTEYVPKAAKLTESNQLMRSAGCYGCHRIEGWDHMRKPAPSLKKVKGKLTRDWIVKWVRNPQSFNDHARMPAVFHQSNITTEEFKQYQEAEIHAITDYVLHNSEDYRPNYSVGGGNAEAGKKLFSSVGCLGCHQVADIERKRGRFGFAPDLSTVGSKVSRDWLTSWLKNPRHYWAETTMPSLRLSDTEIADLSAYLMAKKNPDFEAAEAGKPDVDAQKRVLKLYLLRDPKMAPATDAKVDEFINKMSPEQIAAELGKNAVSRYGCYGCHEMKGFETTQGIGTELTEWGSKPVNKLDFGLLHVEHTLYDWVHEKLTNTRIYDKGVVKEYLDLLRMPQFGFTEEEKHSITLGLLGMTALRVPAALPTASTLGGKFLNARESEMETGLRVVHQYNCQGCHVIEQLFQPLPDDHPGFEENQKKRFSLEGRILAYYEEDESYGPPPLVTEGSRVLTSFAYRFLENPASQVLRPRLDVRMPTFQLSNDELNKIVSYWGAYGQQWFPFAPKQEVHLSPEDRAAAQVLFNKLQCANCHTVGQKLARSQMEGSKGLAPDLTLSYGRLKKDWIVELLKDPQKMIPGTRMPGFWPEMQSPLPEVLKGDSKRQMEVLAEYVLSLGQGKQAD